MGEEGHTQSVVEGGLAGERERDQSCAGKLILRIWATTQNYRKDLSHSSICSKLSNFFNIYANLRIVFRQSLLQEITRNLNLQPAPSLSFNTCLSFNTWGWHIYTPPPPPQKKNSRKIISALCSLKAIFIKFCVCLFFRKAPRLCWSLWLWYLCLLWSLLSVSLLLCVFSVSLLSVSFCVSLSHTRHVL